MKSSTSSDDYLDLLFAQDTFLNSKEFEEHRARVLARLSNAAAQEKRARKFALIASACCAILFVALYAGAILRMRAGGNLPEWLLYLVALVIILSPLTALLLFSIYLFRYRREFVRARREARSQAMLEMPHQIAELRKELQELRAQLAKDREDKPSSEKRDKGFTLLEMLMVIAIIALLSALLLPGLAGAKARGRTTTCKNNLRQMGHALAMYESDFGFLPGCGDSLIVTNNYPLEFSFYQFMDCPHPAIRRPAFGHLLLSRIRAAHGLEKNHQIRFLRLQRRRQLPNLRRYGQKSRPRLRKK